MIQDFTLDYLKIFKLALNLEQYLRVFQSLKIHMGGQFSNFAVQTGPVQYIKYSIARVVKATEFPP